MNSAFIVCWVLMFPQSNGQESCTPEMDLLAAHKVMELVVAAGDFTNISMRMAPTVTLDTKPITLPPPPGY